MEVRAVVPLSQEGLGIEFRKVNIKFETLGDAPRPAKYEVLEVHKVDKSSRSHREGVKVGDMLVSVNGVEIRGGDLFKKMDAAISETKTAASADAPGALPALSVTTRHARLLRSATGLPGDTPAAHALQV
eukprot:SAG11_NODE_22004_length_414_cov_0.812698_1_plen_129_part_01